jgi:hypothetical protein
MYLILCYVNCLLPSNLWINAVLFGVIFTWQSNIHCFFEFFLCSYCLVVSSNSINLGRCLQLGESLETWCGFYQSISPHIETFLFLILVVYHHSQFLESYTCLFFRSSTFLFLQLIYDQNNMSHILHSISQCLWCSLWHKFWSYMKYWGCYIVFALFICSI